MVFVAAASSSRSAQPIASLHMSRPPRDTAIKTPGASVRAISASMSALTSAIACDGGAATAAAA